MRRFGCEGERREVAEIPTQWVSNNSVQGVHTAAIWPTGNSALLSLSLCDFWLVLVVLLDSRHISWIHSIQQFAVCLGVSKYLSIFAFAKKSSQPKLSWRCSGNVSWAVQNSTVFRVHKTESKHVSLSGYCLYDLTAAEISLQRPQWVSCRIWGECPPITWLWLFTYNSCLSGIETLQLVRNS